jgi:hypothetical protein
VARTQFKKGQKTSGAGARDPKNRGTPEQRSAAVSKAKNTFWSKCSPERRSEIGRAVSAGQLKLPKEVLAARSRTGGFAHKGKPKSEATKAKMAEARRAWWRGKRGVECINPSLSKAQQPSSLDREK